MKKKTNFEIISIHLGHLIAKKRKRMFEELNLLQNLILVLFQLQENVFYSSKPPISKFKENRKKETQIHTIELQRCISIVSKPCKSVHRRHLYKIFFFFFLISAYRGRSVSSEHENSESEQTEKSPLVSAKLETFTRLLFSRTTSNLSQENTNYSNNSARDNNSSPIRWFINNDKKLKTNNIHSWNKIENISLRNNNAVCVKQFHCGVESYLNITFRELLNHLLDYLCLLDNCFLVAFETFSTSFSSCYYKYDIRSIYLYKR